MGAEVTYAVTYLVYWILLAFFVGALLVALNASWRR